MQTFERLFLLSFFFVSAATGVQAPVVVDDIKESEHMNSAPSQQTDVAGLNGENSSKDKVSDEKYMQVPAVATSIGTHQRAIQNTSIELVAGPLESKRADPGISMARIVSVNSSKGGGDGDARGGDGDEGDGTEGVGDSDLGLALDMARVSSSIYTEDPAVHGHLANYTLTLGWFQKSGSVIKTEDQFGLYTSSAGICVLVAAGTNDKPDVFDDLDVRSGSICGMSGVHQGFARETDQFLKSSKYNDTIKPYMQTNCTKIYLAGHSMGGSIASILAGCAANKHPSTPWPLHGLFTFGAPAVSENQIQAAGNGCMPGLRVYNYDEVSADPVPAITYPVGLQHPKISVLRIKDTCRDCGFMNMCRCCCSGGYKSKHLPCNSESSKSQPRGLLVSPSIGDHGIENYGGRLLSLLHEAPNKGGWDTKHGEYPM